MERAIYTLAKKNYIKKQKISPLLLILIYILARIGILFKATVVDKKIPPFWAGLFLFVLSVFFNKKLKRLNSNFYGVACIFAHFLIKTGGFAFLVPNNMEA